MIETCNKRRMLIGIILLGGLTIFGLVVESHWTGLQEKLTSVSNTSKLEPCWMTEYFDVIEPCHSCSTFEVRSRSVDACSDTGFKETIKCSKSGDVIVRSCKKVSSLERKKYWTFEFVMFAIAVLSYLTVYYRSRLLERRAMMRVRKQLTNGLSN